MNEREWHLLDPPEFWDEGPLNSNKDKLPEKEGFYLVCLVYNKKKRRPKIMVNAYFINEKDRGHFWDPDTNICCITEYAVSAWMDLPPFPEVPDGKTTSA